MKNGSTVGKIILFYREIPSSLEKLIKSDGLAAYTKDGIKKIGDKMAPRLTIELFHNGQASQAKRIKRFVDHLSLLERSNQIVSYEFV